MCPFTPYLFQLIALLLVISFVFLLVKFILKEWFLHQSAQLKMKLEHQQKEQLFASKNSYKEALTPVKLQAYERMVLLLERISPYSLIMRMHKPGMTVGQCQSLLVKSIRDEFEHNLSQQLYISSESWELIRKAKEDMVALINRAATTLPAESTSTDLSQRILELAAMEPRLSTAIALDVVKNEIKLLY